MPLLHTDEVVAAADLVVLAVPDDTLPGLVSGLAETGVWRAGQLTFHTSGAHGLAVDAREEPTSANNVRHREASRDHEAGRHDGAAGHDGAESLEDVGRRKRRR